MPAHHAIAPMFILIASPAMADITADDVWQNTRAFYAATGGNLTATLTREDNTVFVDDVQLTYLFPFDVGQLIIGMPPMTMIDEAGGTVTQKLPKSFDLKFSLQSTPILFGDFELRAVVTQADFSATATGTPGDITYDRTAAAFGAIVDFNLGDGGEDISMAFNFTGEGYTHSAQVTEGALVQVALDSTTGLMRYDFSSDEGYGFRSEGGGVYEASVGRLEMALPAGGADITNLASALDAGMFIDATSTTAGTTDEAVSYMDDEVFSRDSTSVGPTQSTTRLSADGLEGSVEAEAFDVTYEELSFLNLSVGVTMDRMSGRYRFPLMARDGLQAFDLAMQFDGLAMNDDTWDLFDANRAIPRDAASFDLDLVGELGLDVDLVNFLALETAFDGPDIPVRLETISLNSLALSAAGVTADGSGEFRFDNTDLASFDGLPRPQGQAEVVVTGANGLLDTLIDAGILPASEAGMGRMMMGMFTRPVGDDQLKSDLEINAEGQIIVNGERVR